MTSVCTLELMISDKMLVQQVISRDFSFLQSLFSDVFYHQPVQRKQLHSKYF